ncbi:hypothetical protein FRC02_001091 [Tulasnella sp. 418]|nr:hypothetical protein FRC02_001091 [Tulasnella sp. 418]
MELRERTTRLKMFRILVEPPSQQVPAILQSLLQHLLSESPHLSSISLPQFCLTRCLVDALGSLPDLRKLTYSDSGTSATPIVTEGCDFRFDSSSFPALVDVSFNMSLPDTQVVLKDAKREGSLTSITIGTRPWITGKRVLNEFLDVLVATNPGIESVNFNLFQDRVTVMEVLDGHDLLPLRKLKLKSFIIGHNRPFVVTSSDLQWMSEAWPNISTLVLNPDPVITQPESPPEGHDLTTLNCFAKSFPKLRRLGIYATIHHGFKSFTSENRFFYLDIIDLGTSALSQDCVDPVAAFLASLMPSISAVICSGPSIRHPLPSQDYYLSQWNTVRQLFPNYFRAQSDLRRRLETYQRIAEQLQLQLL